MGPRRCCPCSSLRWELRRSASRAGWEASSSTSKGWPYNRSGNPQDRNGGPRKRACDLRWLHSGSLGAPMADTVADLLVDRLIEWEVDMVFSLPGDGINGIFESLRRRQDLIKVIQVRHEEAAAFAACGYA